MIVGSEAHSSSDLRHLLREVEIALRTMPLGDVGQQAELDPVRRPSPCSISTRVSRSQADAILQDIRPRARRSFDHLSDALHIIGVNAGQPELGRWATDCGSKPSRR